MPISRSIQTYHEEISEIIQKYSDEYLRIEKKLQNQPNRQAVLEAIRNNQQKLKNQRDDLQHFLNRRRNVYTFHVKKYLETTFEEHQQILQTISEVFWSWETCYPIHRNQKSSQ